MSTSTPTTSLPLTPLAPNSRPKPTHLIIVCCHAIYTGPSFPSPSVSNQSHTPSPSPSHPSNWLLAPFQTGEIPTFTAHMKAGLSLLASDDTSLLVFSGSKTRPEIEKSEARGYLDFCIRNEFWGILEAVDYNKNQQSSSTPPPPPSSSSSSTTPTTPTPAAATAANQSVEYLQDQEQLNIHLEEQALDSFSNLLFSLLLFHKRTRTWPAKISVISHAFKEPRFMDLHVPTLRFPSHRVHFVGIDPDYMDPGCVAFDEVRAESVRKGERERGFKVWEGDRFGIGGELSGKRRGRNFWGVGQGWFDEEEERRRSGVGSWKVDGEGNGEEVLGEGRQPWEED
ncbi:hypothetical protein BKA61DRAFT_736204 [Leptodontidium sp. MPI-SDFR-AT-0119]|nr:hypothetical protein BKA61DRAFT_736204 [Leptodontidium sp. MPI-SDFR-AT-0119]